MERYPTNYYLDQKPAKETISLNRDNTKRDIINNNKQKDFSTLYHSSKTTLSSQCEQLFYNGQKYNNCDFTLITLVPRGVHPNPMKLINHIYFPKLKSIHLIGKDIRSIQALQLCQFPLLQSLLIFSTDILYFDSLRKCSFQNLQTITLNYLRGMNLQKLKQMNFKKLNRFKIGNFLPEDQEILFKIPYRFVSGLMFYKTDTNITKAQIFVKKVKDRFIMADISQTVKRTRNWIF